MPTQRRRTLPNAPAKLDPQTRQLFEAISEIVETGEGIRGHPLDRKVTLRDLVGSGIGKLIGNPGGPGGLKPGDGIGTPVPDLSTPPKPEGFAASGGFYGMINLSWTIPGTLYANHAYTKVYRNEADNFANAVVVGQEAGAFYTDYARGDALDPDNPTQLKGYFYWITLVSVAGVEGPPNAPSGTFARPIIDLDYLLDVLNGRLSQSQLNKDLVAKVDRIAVNATAIRKEQESRQAEDEALSRTIQSATAKLGEDITAAVRVEREARASRDDALSKQINTVQSSLQGTLGSVQETLRVQGNAIDGLSAEYMLKLDVDGYVTGIGAYNDGKRSQIILRSDQIAFAPPQGKGGAKSFPVVYDSEVGALVIDTAMIKSGSIQAGQIGPITVGKLTMADGRPVTTVGGLIRADAIDADNLSVAEAARFYGDVFSNNYQQGKSGWAILQSGYVEFNEAMIRGNLEVRSLTVNGQAPFGAISVSSASFSENPSAGTHTYTLDAYDELSAIPGGGRVSVTAYPKVTGSMQATLGRWVRNGSDPRSGPNYDAVTETARYSVAVRTRLWVNGELLLDDNRTIADYAHTSGPIGGDNRNGGGRGYSAFDSFQHPFGGSGLSQNYTFPSYASSPRVRVRIDATVYVGTPSTNVSITGAGTNIGTGDLYRLG